MQRLYVIAFPQMEASDEATLEALRASHDPVGHAMLRAHFTFVFGCDCVPAAVAQRAVQSVAAAVLPINFRASRTMLSRHGDFHYVFLCPDSGASEMLDLHRRLHDGPLAGCLDPGQQFTPHLTVCKTADAERARKVLDQLNRCSYQVDGRLRDLSLGFVADGKFKVLARANLGRAS